MKDWSLRLAWLMVLFLLPGCGGTRLLKTPRPLEFTSPLSIGSDRQLSAHLDAVIVRDGPGTWAKNVDWDEYLISLKNTSGEWLQITGIAAVDSLGTRNEPLGDRRQLVKQTKATRRRYKGQGIEVKAGLGPVEILGTGTVLTAGTAAAGGSAILASELAAGGNLAGLGAYFFVTGTAAAGIILVPAFAIYRAVNNNRVNKQIVSRQAHLPIELRAGREERLHVFFPLTPSPRRIEITYVDSRGMHKLNLETTFALGGLHLAKTRAGGQK